MTGRSLARIALIAGFALVLSASSAEAQRTPERKGFWIGFGLGVGSVYGDAFLDDAKFGGGGFLRMGGSPSQQILIGGDMIGWTGKEGDVDVSRGVLLATFMWYPSPTGGFFTKIGAGLSGRQWKFEREINQGGNTVITTVEDESGGIGFGLGAGYDIQLGRNFFLTPVVDYIYSGTEGDPASIFMLSIGVGWH